MDLAQKPVYKLDLAAGTSVVNLTTPLVEGDDRAQTFTLELTDKGAPANLNGYSVTAYFGRGKTAEAEADTIPLSGTVSGNVATITLTESCYSRSCYFSMPIRLSNGATGQKRTYLIVRGTVVKSVDGTIIDPDGSVPSLDDLFAQIAVMERSRQAAEEATEEALAAAASADEAREGIQGDLAALAEDIARNTAPPIISTATDSIVTIMDGAARPAVEVISHIEPAQSGSGDPSPNNVRPISGWHKANAIRTGQNLIPMYTTNTTITETWGYSSPIVALEHSLPANVPLTVRLFFTDGAELNTSGTVFILCRADGSTLVESGFAGAKITLTPDQSRIVEAYRLYFNENGVSALLGKTIAHVQLTVDDVVGKAPYLGQALSNDLPEAVYGGKLDWTTGVLTVDRAMLALTGDSIHDYFNLNGWTATVRLPSSQYGAVKCSHYVDSNGGTSLDKSIYFNSAYYGDHICGIRDSRYSSRDAYAAYLDAQAAAGTPVQIVYTLAETVTYQLTPQQLDMLHGINNVWSDCGDTTLSYVADTKLYIDQKLAAIAAATL